MWAVRLWPILAFFYVKTHTSPSVEIQIAGRVTVNDFMV